MTTRLDINLVHDSSSLRVWFHKGQSDRLVLCFTGIGDSDGTPQGYEFAMTATHGGRDSALFFADPGRTWLNHPGQAEEMAEWATAMKRETGASQVMTLGHSMGGFNALAMPAFTQVDVAVGMAPQYSVHADVVPEDDRWMKFRRNIKEFRFRDLGGLLNRETSYYVFHGTGWAEHPQRERFPRQGNLHHFYVRGVGHQLPRHLRKQGLMGEVIENAFLDRPKYVRLALKPVDGLRRPPGSPPPEPASGTIETGPDAPRKEHQEQPDPGPQGLPPRQIPHPERSAAAKES